MSKSALFQALVKNLCVILTGVVVIFSGNVGAVVIDFDDIEVYHDPEWGCFCDHPLTDQYRDKGLVIDSGYLVGEKRADGSNDNQLLGSLTLTLFFVDNFPTRVSMYINAVLEQAVFLTASGNNGWSQTKKTSGYAGPFDDTPYIADQFVSFYAPAGITSISLGTFYGMRTGAVVDNLTFEVIELPEPRSLLLILPLILLLLVRRSGQGILVRKD